MSSVHVPGKQPSIIRFSEGDESLQIISSDVQIVKLRTVVRNVSARVGQSIKLCVSLFKLLYTYIDGTLEELESGMPVDVV